MKMLIFILLFGPIVLFAQNKDRQQPGNPKVDSIPIHIQPAQTSRVKDDASINEFWPINDLPLNKDSMTALFKNKAWDFSQVTKFNYINSSLPQANNKTLGVGQNATYTLMQVPYSTGTRYSTSSELTRWTRALHDDHFVDLTNSQKRREATFGSQWLYIGY